MNDSTPRPTGGGTTAKRQVVFAAVRETENDVVDGARSPAASSRRVIVANESHQGAVDMQITTIGLDIAKNVNLRPVPSKGFGDCLRQISGTK